mgnify:FL=1
MVKIKESHIKIFGASHPGIAGKKNEDRYKVHAFFTGRDGQTPSVIGVLCDGIGGHRAGEVAAEMGVSIITDQVIAGDVDTPLETLRQAILRANQAIYEASQKGVSRNGMGTTCACAWVIGDRLYTANLGDSRIYLLREGHLVQLTTDHTWIQEAIDAGLLAARENGEHPNAHVIRRYLGSKKSPEPDFRLWFFAGETEADALSNQGLALEPGDQILLCSDGLTDLVSDEKIRSTMLETGADALPNTLIKMANRKGGHDNTTVVLLEVPGNESSKARKPGKRRLLIGCLSAFVVMALLTLALFVGIRWRRDILESDPTPAIEIQATLPPLDETVTLAFTLEDTATPINETPQEIKPTVATRTPWPTNTLTE